MASQTIPYTLFEFGAFIQANVSTQVAQKLSPYRSDVVFVPFAERCSFGPCVSDRVVMSLLVEALHLRKTQRTERDFYAGEVCPHERHSGLAVIKA